MNLSSRVNKLEVDTAPAREQLERSEARKRAHVRVSLAKLMAYGISATEAVEVLQGVSREHHDGEEIAYRHINTDESQLFFDRFLSVDAEAARLFGQIISIYGGQYWRDAWDARGAEIEPLSHALRHRVSEYMREVAPDDFAVI